MWTCLFKMLTQELTPHDIALLRWYRVHGNFKWIIWNNGWIRARVRIFAEKWIIYSEVFGPVNLYFITFLLGLSKKTHMILQAVHNCKTNLLLFFPYLSYRKKKKNPISIVKFRFWLGLFFFNMFHSLWMKYLELVFFMLANFEI